MRISDWSSDVSSSDLRSNAQSRVLEHALFSSGIPYKVYGGLRFFERQEVKHALAYLRLMDNPHDDPSWLRVVNFPTLGIGARTLDPLSALARQPHSRLLLPLPLLSGNCSVTLAAFPAVILQLATDAQ